MILFASGLKNEIIKMWKTSFFDTDAYYDLYFDRVYRDDNTLVKIYEDRPVASLQLLSYKMNFFNEKADIGYLSGVVTLPEYRGRGFSGELIAESFKKMYDSKVYSTALIPQNEGLFNFYSRFGYVTTHYLPRSQRALSKAGLLNSKNSLKRAEPADLVPAYDFYRGYFEDKNLAVLKSFYDFESMYIENSLWGGLFLLTDSNGSIKALAFCEHEKALAVREMISREKADADELLGRLTAHYRERSCTFTQPYGEKPLHPLAMSRIIYLKGVLEAYAAANPGMSLKLDVSDPMIDENNGLFALEGGRVLKGGAGDGGYIKTDITDLTLFMMGKGEISDGERSITIGNFEPYMNMMLN